MIFEATGERHVAYRVKWSLDKDEFDHDFNCPTGTSSRIESDFCELTFALVRVETVTRVGGLDDDFGFYHEDADLCFRLRQAGFSCAYALSDPLILHTTANV
jgi:GT2 family glycosyltransferase